jgi:sigma-B regulation protein RsbU (phosphoserine phosphatase)
MPALTDAQRRIAELTTLNALALTLNRAVDLREALDSALSHIVELMNLSTGWIFLRDEGDTYRLVARHGLPPAIDYPGAAWKDVCSCQEMCSEGKLHKAVNMVRCSRLRYAVGDKRGLYQHASIPLRIGDDILGILNVATTEFGRFTQPQLQLLSTVGLLLGTAITRMRLHDEVTIRRVQEQATLLQLSQDLLGASALEPALQRLVRVGARLLHADACAFVEADEDRGRATLLAAHGWRYLPNTGLPTVLDATNPHLWYLPDTSTSLAKDTLDDLPQLLAAQKFQGHVSQEVSIGGAPVGTLMVNTRTQRQFLHDEIQLLALLGSQLAQTLERERLHQEALARQRLEQELDLARDIQASFLPECCPNVPGYQVAAFYRAARQVGGDFYDFIALGDETRPASEPTVPRVGGKPQRRGRGEVVPPELDGRFGVVIADVTDKGVPAALFMALSRTLIRATAIDGRAPASVLDLANRLILDDARSGLFVTTFYGVLDSQTGEFVYANGGHNYPLLYRPATDEMVQLQAPGLVLGIMPEARFEQRSVQIDYGDVLCLYTDGVTESMNTRRQLFDEQRLIDVLRASHHLPADQIIEQILDAVLVFSAGVPQIDDITLVVMKREHKPNSHNPR